jgi:hypothetical protein
MTACSTVLTPESTAGISSVSALRRAHSTSRLAKRTARFRQHSLLQVSPQMNRLHTSSLQQGRSAPRYGSGANVRVPLD